MPTRFNWEGNRTRSPKRAMFLLVSQAKHVEKFLVSKQAVIPLLSLRDGDADGLYV